MPSSPWAYHDFRVAIYKKTTASPDQQSQFYYSPALILDPSKTRVIKRSGDQKLTVRFEVVMWDHAYEQAVLQAVSVSVGQNVSSHQIRVLPIEEIRIDSRHPMSEYELDNIWRTYGGHRGRFQFFLGCKDEVKCAVIEREIKQNSDVFVADLVVYYSLETQRTFQRQVRPIYIISRILLRDQCGCFVSLVSWIL